MKICLLGFLLAVLVAKGFAVTDPINTGNECRCPGATLACVRNDTKDSINGKCPPCPAACAPTRTDDCNSTEDCTDGECQIEDDAARKCILDVTEGNNCTYIKNCINRGDCEAVFSGEKREKKCASGHFCRARANTTNCLVTGTCVLRAVAMLQEARCLRNISADKSRCYLDGDYRCSTTESSGGRVTQTCYNPSTGRPTSRVITEGSEEVAKVDCREELATCTSINGREVLSGDRVEDTNNPCSYCLCKDGRISRSLCKMDTRCDPNPTDCTFNGETIPNGKVVTSPNGCIQKRCRNGEFVTYSDDMDCDGKDDVDACADQTDRNIVCVKTMEGVRARVPKCKARSITNSVVSNNDCDEEACNCANDEICVETSRPTELCIDTTTDSSGCKAKKCISKADTVRCSTQDTNTRVCSTSGNSYSSECEAFINQDYELKYLRDCDDAFCANNNAGRGFCGFDNKTYETLCHLERKTGFTQRDYDGTCKMNFDEPNSMCEGIPEGCVFTTRASDANCFISGGQCVLHIDLIEAQEYAFRKSKTDLDIKDLCAVAESDWEKLTGFKIKDDKCEFTCRPKYDTVGAIVVQARAEQGAQCATCGNRMKDFISKVREGKSTNTVPGGRKRRQTDETDSSGLFINPGEVYNDPNFHNGAYNLIASSLLILTSVVLALML